MNLMLLKSPLTIIQDFFEYPIYTNMKLINLDNGSQLKNLDISGALYTLGIQYKYTQTQREDGARDFRLLKFTPVIWLK